MVTVQYTGPRYMPMVVDVYIDGTKTQGRGYRFGLASPGAVVTEAEAELLTGVSEQIYVDGIPVNAVVSRGKLTPEQAALETWEVVEEKTVDGIR